MNRWKENANSRLESLLKLIGINEDEVAEQVINPDWNNVDKRLEIERKYSLDFLKEELDWKSVTDAGEKSNQEDYSK